MELRWPLVLQEGNKVVKHVFLKVLTINPPEGVQERNFSTQFKLLSHTQGAHTSLGEGKTEKERFI